MRLIDADALIAEYDRVHVGPPGGARKLIEDAPTIEPEIKPIEYRDCANAMLRMWMDNVITNGEYNRIMDKLNAFWEMSKDGN